MRPIKGFVSLLILLSFVFRRIWLQITSVAGIPLVIVASILAGLTSAKTFKKKDLFFRLALVASVVISVVCGISNWKYSLSVTDALENSTFLVFLLIAPFLSYQRLYINLDKLIFWGVVAGTMTAIMNRMINDTYALQWYGVYGWANSSIYSAFLLSAGSLCLVRGSRIRSSLAIFLGGVIFLMDQQRGALVSLVGVLLVFGVGRGDYRWFIKMLFFGFLLLLITESMDRRGGGFVASIFFPQEYAEEYSSGLSRLTQVTAYIEHFFDIKNLIFGSGPFFSLYTTGWNDLHMGYISFLMKWGVVCSVLLTVLYWPALKLIFSVNRDDLEQSRFAELFVLVCLFDATTQTTFDSVPTAFMLLFGLVAVWERLDFMKITRAKLEPESSRKKYMAMA